MDTSWVVSTGPRQELHSGYFLTAPRIIPQLREGPSPLSSFKVHAGSPPFISESVKDVNYICKIPLALPCKIILGMISDCFCYFLWLEAKSQVLPSVKRWRLHKSVTHWKSPYSVSATWVHLDGSSLINTKTSREERAFPHNKSSLITVEGKENKGSPLANTTAIQCCTRDSVMDAKSSGFEQTRDLHSLKYLPWDTYQLQRAK